MAKLPLSVSIISFNEADRIRPTLESVKDFAAEIIIVDSFSSDGTQDLARSYGAKVFEEKWQGFAKQKNLSMSKCSQDWILCLDSDEEITPELALEIEKAIKSPKASGYIINRKTMYLGKVLNHSWQPDNRLRLVKRSDNPCWQGEVVHEELVVNGITARLSGYMVHRSYRGICDHMAKTVKYAELSAKSYYDKGRKPSLIKILFSPFFAFIKLYFINLGFLDGVRGLIAAGSAYIYSLLKYAFLWDIHRRSRGNHE